jgi:hypothetical protein
MDKYCPLILKSKGVQFALPTVYVAHSHDTPQAAGEIEMRGNFFKKKDIVTFKIVVAGLLLLSTVQASQADCWYNTRRDNGQVNAYYDASVVNTTTGWNYTSLFDTARTNWSAISTKVKLYKSTSTVNVPDKYYVGTSDPNNPGVAGITLMYKKNTSGVIVTAAVDDTWEYCTIAIYHDTITGAGYGTNAGRLGVIQHEMGHSLKMAHPGAGSQRVQAMGTGNRAIMEGGTTVIYDIQPYDKQELKYKWGL